jgi:hypothetical protein
MDSAGGNGTTGTFTIYEQEGVLLTTKGISGDSSNLFLGKLRIVNEKTGIFLVWMSDDSAVSNFPGSHEPDWTVIDPAQGSVTYQNCGSSRPIHFEVEDLKCICLSSIADSSGKLLFPDAYFNVVGNRIGSDFQESHGGSP